MQLNKDQLVHINSIAHAGKIIVVATFSDGSLQYTVRQDGFEPSYLHADPAQRSGWEGWRELPLPDDAIGDPSVSAREQATLSVPSVTPGAVAGASELLLRSRYQSKFLGAVVPVQLVSAQDYLYVFRQSTSQTLLVDRLIFDGLTNELKPKLEVRYRRSRQRYSAQSPAKRGTPQSFDTLDFTDMSGGYFYEPTTELCLIKDVSEGRFAVVQVPTGEHDKFRWHFFVHRVDVASGRGQVELVSLRTSEEGLFDVSDYTLFERSPSGADSVRVIPGILRRTIAVDGGSIASGPAATLYDVQREATNTQTKESYLLRSETRLMLALPTEQGVTALSFAIAEDGTLSQISEARPSQRTLRSEERVVLLPLNTLDQVVPMAAALPPAEGTITGLAQGALEIDASGQVVVSSPQAASLKDGDLVQLSGTAEFDGQYSAASVSGNTFEIAAPVAGATIGSWKKQAADTDTLVYEGRVTAYAPTADGKLRVDAANHQLKDGDRVQIIGSTSYDGTYPITKLDDSHFVISAPWQPLAAQNLRILADRRRGIVLDGVGDYIELPTACFPTGSELTISFFARGGSSLPNTSCVFYAADGNRARAACIHLPWSDGVIYFDGGADRICKAGDPADFQGRWTHWAFTKNSATGEMKIYLDGALWHSEVGKQAPIAVPGSKITFVAAGRIQPGPGCDHHWDGSLSELQIWSRALSAAEINNYMYSAPAPSEPDLMGRWPLGAICEGTARTVLDFSVHGRDGTIQRDSLQPGPGAYVSAISLPRNLASPAQGPAPLGTTALGFDGRDDYVALPAMNIDWSAGVTIEAWVRYERFNQYSRVVDFSNGAQNGNIILAHHSGNPNLLGQVFSSQGSGWLVKDGILETGVWQHVAVSVAPGGIGKLYKNGQLVLSGTLALPDNVNRVQNFIGRSAFGDDGYFQGQLCELRVWKVVRGEADILRDCRRRISGSEAGLVGYWPMDEGAGGQVFDRVQRTSGSPLHGTINGAGWQSMAVYFGAPPPPPPAPIWVRKYVNEEIFPVVTHATYREEFEFKLAAATPYDPRNVDGGYPLFEFAYWGRRSRAETGAATVLPAGPTSFTPLSDGWWRASCLVTIPSGIGYLRLFEIKGLTWPVNARGNLEVRKHRICIVSEAITEEGRLETIRLAPAPASDSTEQKLLVLQRSQRDLAALEQREGRLLLELQTLEVRRARILDALPLGIDTAALSQKVDELSRETQRLQALYNQELNNPLNYYCRLQVQLPSGEWRWVSAEAGKRLSVQTTMGPRVRFTGSALGGSNVNYKMAFEVAPGAAQDSFRAVAGQTSDTGSFAMQVLQTMVIGINEFSGPWLRFEPTADGSAYRILKLAASASLNSYLEVCSEAATGALYIRRNMNSQGSLFRVVQTDDHLTYGNAISAAQSSWATKKAEYESWAALRDSAAGSVADCDSRISALRSALSEVQSRIAAIQSAGMLQDLNTLNSDVGAPRFAMASLATDARGLCTQHATLPFVGPANRLSAIETCEGYVQLTYVDDAGRMRQTVYHAAADGAAGVAFEKWFPEPPRGCANLHADRSIIALNQPLALPAEWSIEAWIYYPLPRKDWNVIATTNDGQNSQLLLREGKYLGSRIGGLFFSSGYSLEGLSPGWHHLAQTKRGTAASAALRFYLDGDLVGRPILANGSILSLHGGSDKVTLPKDSLPSGDALTYCVFARGNATNAGSAYLLRARSAAGADLLTVQLQHGDPKDKVLFTCGADSLSVDIDRPGDDEWTHWAFAKSLSVGAGTMVIYRNGKQVAAAGRKSAALPAAATVATLTIGDGYAGSLLEPSLWNKTMWAADLAAWIGQIATGSEDKLGGVWRFDDKIATDRSGKKKHGTLEGSPTLVPLCFDDCRQIEALGNVPMAQAVPSVNSVHPSAVSLNGSNQIVELASGSWPAGNEVSIGFYSKGGGSLPGGTTILSAYAPNVGRELNIHLPWLDGTLYFDCAGDRISQAVPAALYKGAWTHWVFTKNAASGEMKIYCNGELFASGSGKVRATSPATRFTVGALNDAGTSCYYPGQLAELQVWSKVLSPEEVRFYKDNCPLGSESALAAYYRFVPGAAQDLTPSQRSGQYVGGPSVAVDSSLTLSARTPGPTPIGQPCGKLAEVRVWSCALSSDEINANSVSLPTGREPGLLAYYGLRTLPSNIAWGQTESDPDGVLSEGSYSACSPPIGNPGNACLFLDGIDGHVSLPELAFDSTSGLSVEAWVLCDKFVPYSRILDFGNGQGADNLILCLGAADGSVHFEVYRGSTGQGFQVGGVLELGRWIHVAVTVSATGSATLYRDGVALGTGTVPLPANVRRSKNYLGRSNWSQDKYFDGQLAEVRLWSTVRSRGDLRSNLHRSLLGKEDGLRGYWPLDALLPGNITKVRDHGPTAAHGTLANSARVVLTNALPVGVDAVVSAEYTTLGYDPADASKKMSMMRRFFGGRVLGAALLLPDKRVEAVELKWVGNGQFQPTLLGYIEGAPPVPSENLTVAADYSGATSVELSVADSVDYSWSRSQSSAMGGSLDLFLGVDTQSMGGLGVMEQLLSVKVGAKGSLNSRKEQASSTNITSSSTQTVADRLELRGTQESAPAFPQLGPRFVPRNVGYALVVSSLADVYISRLRKSGRMVGYTILPVEGIPPDVNTITFLLNPAYVMQGSLDGMVGSHAASERFHRHVPDMRTEYGALYPASYYRLEEAYALKEKIEAADKRRAAYFAQFDAADPGGEFPLDMPTGKPSADMIGEVLGKIQDLGDELSQKLHASTAFLSWQKKMEDLLVKSGKRNIVNTYVWDADGGLHADQQSFANTVEHTIGGSFSLDASIGFQSDVTMFGAAADLTALMNFNLTQSISKTERHSTAVQLNVDLHGVESTGVTDANDRPLAPGEKVDRYRFMTFYLEGSTDNFHDFFQKVVDPEWLQSNSEEARALRQAKGKANKAWRILHRVTYVERPALRGVGQAVRNPAAESAETDATSEILRYFDLLSVRHQQVVRRLDQGDARYQVLADKIDQILRKLNG